MSYSEVPHLSVIDQRRADHSVANWTRSGQPAGCPADDPTVTLIHRGEALRHRLAGAVARGRSSGRPGVGSPDPLTPTSLGCQHATPPLAGPTTTNEGRSLVGKNNRSGSGKGVRWAQVLSGVGGDLDRFRPEGLPQQCVHGPVAASWSVALPSRRLDWVESAPVELQSDVDTFVLIPGAGGSAWVWSRVTRLLVEAGHEAIAVELPGDDQTAGLPRYADLVVDAIGSRARVILVAGSLGGFTAPLVCERVPVRGLVLVNAMIPVPGETAHDWWTHTGAIAARDEAARAGGYGPFDVASYFLHDVDVDTVAEGESYQRLEADIAFECACDFAAWPAVNIRVLAGEDDRFFPVDLQRRLARDRLGVRADVIPGGHLLPLVKPRLVADYLLNTPRLGTPGRDEEV